MARQSDGKRRGWRLALASAAVLLAVLGAGSLASAQRPLIPAYKLAAWQQEQQFAAAGPAAAAVKPAHPSPPVPGAAPQGLWGLLPADVGPVPLPSRLFSVSNKWLGEVDGAFTALYAGAEVLRPQQGILAVFQPDSPGNPLRVYRTATALGSLRIAAVRGSTVTLTTPAGGSATFDLSGRRFH